MHDHGREPRRWDGFNPEVRVQGSEGCGRSVSVAVMGQKRKENPESDGRPICRHAKTKVWFREKKGNHAQTQTFTTPWGSSGDSDCSSSKWHDPPSTPSDTECRRFDSGYEDIIPRSNPKCESRASSRQEKRIYLHLNLKNRESPQLVVCPKRNHHPSTSRDSTVIDVDDLPLPSRPPSRSRLSEPALSSSSSFARSGYPGGFSKPVSLSHDFQLQSLRQAHQGSGSRSSSDKVPSPTASSITPRRMSLAQLHHLAHERAMSATPRSCSELDLRYNLAFRRHDDDEQSQSHSGAQETGEFHGAARNGCHVGETSLAQPERPHGDRMHVSPGGHMVKIAAPRSSSIKMKSDVPSRVKGGSDTPHSEPVELQEAVESSTPVQTEGVVLSWEGLTVTSKVGKVLLDDLNGQITSGFTAIMGPSGSGKSTLLNTLACRMGQSATIEGRILLNGRHYKIADLKKMSGYVMQDDLLNAHLTVEETLKYTTRLKLEPSLTEEAVYSRVDSIIKQMGLDHVRDTVIGSPDKRGISGGERKRVCVGMELLTHPELLFLDEPTSGLDSVTALSLCEQLQKLASTGHCTIVCTIHQPQAKIFNLFHYLIILKAGQVIYQGKASEVLRFFEESGFPCPEYTNPADHLLDVITPSIDKARDSYRQIDDVLKSKFHALPVNMSQGSEYLVLQTTRERMPWHRQYMVLLNRGVREQIRKKNVLITQLCQSMLCAILIGGVFFQIGNNQKSTVRRQPVLFFCVINQGVFGALTVINSFPGERVLTLRERAAGMYYCSSYFMAKITAEMAAQIISPIIFSCIVYWMVGFQRNGSKFMIFMVLMVLCQLSATSLALMVSAICRTTDLSVTVLPMVLEVNRLFGGFFLSPKSLPNYFAWLDALSYVKYTYTAISLNELHGLTIRCDEKEYVNGACPITSGQQTISSLGLDYLNIGSCVTILIFYILITRAIAYLGIRYLKK